MYFILQSVKLLRHVTARNNWDLINRNADRHKITNCSLFQIVLVGTSNTW